MFFTKKKSVKERYAKMRELVASPNIELKEMYTDTCNTQTPTVEDNFADSICGEYRKAQEFAAHAKGEELYRQVGVATGISITVGLFNLFADALMNNLTYLSCEHCYNSVETLNDYDTGYERGYMDGLDKCIDLLCECGLDVVRLCNGKEE